MRVIVLASFVFANLLHGSLIFVKSAALGAVETNGVNQNGTHQQLRNARVHCNMPFSQREGARHTQTHADTEQG